MKAAFRALAGTAVVGMLVLAGCGNSTGGAGEPTLSGQTYDNPTLGFTLTTPQGWAMAADTVVEGQLLLLHARNLEPLETKLALSVTRNEASEGGANTDPMVMLAYVELGLKMKEANGDFTDLQMVDTTSTVVDSVVAGVLVFDAVVGGNLNRSFLVYLIHDTVHLILTFSGPPASVENQLDVIQGILDEMDLY